MGRQADFGSAKEAKCDNAWSSNLIAPILTIGLIYGDYRELFAVLAWRDLSVRYKETVFGVLWALLRPFLTMLVLAIIFGRLAKFPSDGDVPYPLLVLVGMILWTLFSTSWTEVGSSLIRDSEPDHQGVLSKNDRADGVHDSELRRFSD